MTTDVCVGKHHFFTITINYMSDKHLVHLLVFSLRSYSHAYFNTCNTNWNDPKILLSRFMSDKHMITHHLFSLRNCSYYIKGAVHTHSNIFLLELITYLLYYYYYIIIIQDIHIFTVWLHLHTTTAVHSWHAMRPYNGSDVMVALEWPLYV